MLKKIRLGISSCLLGNNVRYNGGHQLNKYLRDKCGEYIEWVPVCPEVECGLPIPRETMRLVGDPENPMLKTSRTGMDHTQRMLDWTKEKLEKLYEEDLCGFVFKSKSPSSGMRGVKVYDHNGMPNKKGSGLFAGQFMKRFPTMPVEDDGRLNDDKLRENFIERIFVVNRWKTFLKENPTINGLVSFHSSHKLLIMAHHPTTLRKLGKIVAAAKKSELNKVLNDYFIEMMEGLRLISTIKKNTNVLQHIMGYFKKKISHDEKQELIEVIENYHAGLVPLVVPVVLLQHYVRKYDETYLKIQHYLHPHPMELMLRNHV